MMNNLEIYHQVLVLNFLKMFNENFCYSHIKCIFFQNKLYAGNITAEVRQSYKERTEFVKKYISTIKENRKTNKKFKGSVVEVCFRKIIY